MANATVAKKAATKPHRITQNCAANELQNIFGAIFALDDIARRFEQSPFTFITMQESIEALNGSAVARIETLAGKLPRTSEALPYLKEATHSLNDLSEFVLNIGDGGDGQVISLRIAGAAMRGFVVAAGQHIDRAILALGGAGGGTSGYLHDPNFEPNRIPAEVEADNG
jgi:hypothetical protein